MGPNQTSLDAGLLVMWGKPHESSGVQPLPLVSERSRELVKWWEKFYRVCAAREASPRRAI